MSTILPDNVDGRRRRRLHSDEFKADAVAACMQPGLSMAAVAMSRGIDANLLRRWVRLAKAQPERVPQSAGRSDLGADAGLHGIATAGAHVTHRGRIPRPA